MEYRVKLFYDGHEIPKEDFKKILISNKTIDRIVNSIYDSVTQSEVNDSVNRPAEN